MGAHQSLLTDIIRLCFCGIDERHAFSVYVYAGFEPSILLFLLVFEKCYFCRKQFKKAEHFFFPFSSKRSSYSILTPSSFMEVFRVRRLINVLLFSSSGLGPEFYPIFNGRIINKFLIIRLRSFILFHFSLEGSST